MMNDKKININKLISTRVIRYSLIVSLLPTFAHGAQSLGSNTRLTLGIDMGIAVDLNRDGVITFDKVQTRIKDNAIVEKVANDKTHPKIPYRFWINNDLDVVSNNGSTSFIDADCAGKNDAFNDGDEYQQTCEVWDIDPRQPGKTITNTSTGLVFRIENYRDLEDFAPIDIKIDATVDTKAYEWQIRSVGIDINLFKRHYVTSDLLPAHGYIFNTQRTQEQFNTANGVGNAASGHFAVLVAGKAKTLSQSDLDKFFLNNADGIGRFIFEGMETSQTNCMTDGASTCYIELSLVNKKTKEVLSGFIKKLYIDLHDVKDFYELINAGPSAQTAGQTYQLDEEYSEGERDAFHASYNNNAIATNRSINLNIYDGLFSSTEITKDYILQVHGWRVLDAEKTNFSETSYKRLYWSGYKGQMGALHWPTGWFDKPADEYGIGVLPYVLGNERNYDISEVVARRVGVNLVAWINGKKPSIGNLHAVTHSMGNLVISEALHNGATLTSYTAGQAAIDAGSFDSEAADMDHEFQVPGFISCPIDVSGSILFGDKVDPETAWRCYNTDNLLPPLVSTDYDMPPDMYRRDLIVRDANGDPVTDAGGNYTIRHGKTSIDTMSSYTSTPGNENYYLAGLANNAYIVNFFNKDDAALTAWEFNQLTKPDFAQVIPWNYSNSYLDDLLDYYNCSSSCGTLPVEPSEASSSFSNGATPVPYQPSTAFEILSHVIPARTEPLGQVETGGEISSNPEMTGFTNSNQDHSAPYHGYYSEVSPNPAASTQQQRAAFWNEVLTNSLDLDPLAPSNDLTGLKNGIEN